MHPFLPTSHTLGLLLPEILLVAGMGAVLMAPFVRRGDRDLPAMVSLIAVLAALAAAAWTTLHAPSDQFQYASMLAIDRFSQFVKVVLLLAAALVLVQWFILGRSQTSLDDTPDFLCLLLGAVTGMALMASATNLLMMFMAMEAASLPSFALAGFRKRHRVGSEGSLKYVVFGAAASAVGVYGMSLIYGATGSLDLATIAQRAHEGLSGGGGADGATGISPMLAVGLLAMFAGIAFKLSAVPMHFWCPDVFQGAPLEIATFLSIASKGAAVALLVRVLAAFGEAGSFTGLAVGIVALGAVTATWGNLVAFHQNHLVRLLAYSSIAHAGYMIMVAGLLAAGGGTGRVEEIGGALLFYLLVYLFMNLGAFTVAGLVARAAGGFDLSRYAGLGQRSPLLAAMLTLFLLSLFGMPGLGGFMGKIYLMKATSGAGIAGLVVIGLILLNTALSLYYYLRPVKQMYLTPARETSPTAGPAGAELPAGPPREAAGPTGALAGGGVWAVSVPAAAMLVVCAAALLWTGIVPGATWELTASYARLQNRPSATALPAPPAAPEAAPPVPSALVGPVDRRRANP